MTGRFVAAFIITATATASVGDAVAQERVSFRYTLTNEVSLNEPVLLKYTLRNQTPGIISLNLGFDRVGALTFELTSPDGSVQRVKPDVPTGFDGAVRGGSLTLGPSEQYTQLVVLDDYLKFRSVGGYVLAVKMGALSVPESGQFGNPTRIFVRARDEAHLRNRCNAMLEEIVVKQNTREGVDLMAALAAVRDPVVTPYLERAAELTAGDRAITALRHLGTPEARDALVRLSSHRSESVSGNAKSALAAFRVK